MTMSVATLGDGLPLQTELGHSTFMSRATAVFITGHSMLQNAYDCCVAAR